MLITCPECEKKLRLNSETEGKRIRCPACSAVFVAAAIAMWLGVKREDLLKPAKKKDDTSGIELP